MNQENQVLKIKYELGKSSFKVFNNIVGKHKYYYTIKKVLYVGLNIYKKMISNEIVKQFAHHTGHHLIIFKHVYIDQYMSIFKQTCNTLVVNYNLKEA